MKKVLEERFTTVSGRPVEPSPGPRHAAGLDFDRDLGFPGEYPYTRGVQPTMYRGKLWTMRQFAGFGTRRQTNERFKYLLEHGQTGLSIAFHLPTLYGYDSDHQMAPARSASAASRSTRSPTWRCSSTASTSATSPRR